MFVNVQSLENKTDKLHSRISMQRPILYRVLFRTPPYCETWLGERTPDEAITPDGYTVFREDHCTADSGKTNGGTAALVKQTWCIDWKMISKSCSEDVEYLTLKLSPFYLPRLVSMKIHILMPLLLFWEFLTTTISGKHTKTTLICNLPHQGK